MKIENWCGHSIRFVQLDNGEWWAVLSDICSALKLSTWRKSQQIPEEHLDKIRLKRNEPTNCGTNSKRGAKTQLYDIVDEFGIYEALFRSQSLEARKFRQWSFNVLQKLRKSVGLEGYEVMRMTEPDIQEQIDHMLDDLFYDPDTGKLMVSVTVQGGDTDQVPFEEVYE